MERTIVETEIGGVAISLETGRVAKQANGAVIVRSGESMVLVTATARREARENAPFFPLTVDVEERMYAAGKIPGGFFKREARPSEKATLTARQIDRPIRPLFPKGFMNETQVVATVLSVDHEHAHDVMAMVGASAALTVSDIPFAGPLGAVRIALVDGKLMVNPPLEDLDDTPLDLVVSGSADAIVMVEASAREVGEELILEALELAHREIRKLVDLQLELQRLVGKEKWDVEPWSVDDAVLAEVRGRCADEIERVTQIVDKLERQEATSALREQVVDELAGDDAEPERRAELAKAFGVLEKGTIRRHIAVDKRRPDGRSHDEIRPISCEVGVVPRTHGSALFTRGETQALTLATLGASGEQQRIDDISTEDSKRYMHHYNFPPFSVGETGFMRGPKRRDIGHGSLAERALRPMIPVEEEFPYTIRLVSEILESNGSSSMASVCGSTLALMDAGVGIKAPVAGVAMGLIKEGDDYIVLTDIAGVEDHLGDMDFKVAGTSEGITALQMDIKITGVTLEILREALEQARKGRLFILDRMLAVLPEPRAELSEYAPRIFSMQVNPDQIGLIIGKGGETIRGMTEEFDVSIDIEDDGTVFISCLSAEGARKAEEAVARLTEDIQVGRIYEGRVASIKDFGAFIEIQEGQDGLCHISELDDAYVRSVSDVVQIGDQVKVKVIAIDDQGRVKLSRKAALKEAATTDDDS